jgi:hypothetical protein
MSYSVNAPQKYSTSTPNATCSGYAFQSSYDNQYNVPFCQKAQMAYSGPDKVAFGVYKQTTLKENYGDFGVNSLFKPYSSNFGAFGTPGPYNPADDPYAIPMMCNDGCPPAYYMYTSTTNTPSKCYCRPK